MRNRENDFEDYEIEKVKSTSKRRKRFDKKDGLIDLSCLWDDKGDYKEENDNQG